MFIEDLFALLFIMYLAKRISNFSIAFFNFSYGRAVFVLLPGFGSFRGVTLYVNQVTTYARLVLHSSLLFPTLGTICRTTVILSYSKLVGCVVCYWQHVKLLF